MCLKKNLLNMVGMCFVLSMLVWPAQAQDDPLSYQNRGHYWEGQKSIIQSADLIELISALIYDEQHQENAMPVPDIYGKPEQFRVNFYLAPGQETNVNLIIREFGNRCSYWLDQVTLDWELGRWNEFTWPTQAVVAQLGLKMYELGVIAKIGQPIANAPEVIAPAVFYYSPQFLDNNIKGYLFTFRVAQDARLFYQIVKQPENYPIISSQLFTYMAGKPIHIQWDGSSATDGYYDLIVTAQFLYTGENVSHAVRFYHKTE